MFSSTARKLFLTAAAIPLIAAFTGCAHHDHYETYHRGWDHDHNVYYVEPRAAYIAPQRTIIIHDGTRYSRDY